MRFDTAIKKIQRNIKSKKGLKYYLFLEEDKKNIDKWIEVDESYIYNTKLYKLEDFIKNTWHTKLYKFNV